MVVTRLLEELLAAVATCDSGAVIYPQMCSFRVQRDALICGDLGSWRSHTVYLLASAGVLHHLQSPPAPTDSGTMNNFAHVTPEAGKRVSCAVTG